MKFIKNERLIYNVLKTDNPRTHKLLLAIIKTYYRHIWESIRENRCPFCRKTFSNRKSIITHLKMAGRCNEMLKSIADDVFSLYNTARKYITKNNSMSANGKYAVLVANPTIKVDTYEEAIEILRREGILP